MKVHKRKFKESSMPNDVVRYVDHAISLAKQIDILLKESNKSRADLAQLLGKSESEISKWMRGTHNFTLKTISKIEAVLGGDLIVCPRDVEKTKYKVLVFQDYTAYKIKGKPHKHKEFMSEKVTCSLSAGYSEIPKDYCLHEQ
jgi:transcriptional regulator with XRE-family HTH domain